MFTKTVPKTFRIVSRGTPHTAEAYLERRMTNFPLRPARRIWPANLRRVLVAMFQEQAAAQSLVDLQTRLRASAGRTEERQPS